MRLSSKTLVILREIINGDKGPNYRSGPKLVAFFNELGFNDSYGNGFPSRWYYTDEKLKAINGTPELDKCIRNTFAVVDYIENITVLDETIAHFNKYMAFDKWAVVRENDTITFKKLDRIIVDAPQKTSTEIQEDEFLNIKFDANIDNLMLDGTISDILKGRMAEADLCIKNQAPLAAIFLIGSIMEGLLLGAAQTYPREINQAICAPKDRESGKTKKYPDWTLNNFIDAAAEIGILNEDVKKFSHVLRDFRNYIHPYQQMASHFTPDTHTALICYQVLNAAIAQIGTYRKNHK